MCENPFIKTNFCNFELLVKFTKISRLWKFVVLQHKRFKNIIVMKFLAAWWTVQLYALGQKICLAKCQASVDMQVHRNLSRVMDYYLVAGRKVHLLRQPTTECQSVAELTTPMGLNLHQSQTPLSCLLSSNDCRTIIWNDSSRPWMSSWGTSPCGRQSMKRESFDSNNWKAEWRTWRRRWQPEPSPHRSRTPCLSLLQIRMLCRSNSKSFNKNWTKRLVD